MTEHTETIEIPSRWTTGIHVAGAVLGFAAAFVVGPLAHWLLGLAGTAPGPLRLAASLPTMWAIPILTVAGLIAGHVIASEWQKENGATTVAPEGMTVTRGDESSYVPRDQIDGVFTDGHDLVVVEPSEQVGEGGQLGRARPGGAYQRRRRRHRREQAHR